MKTALEVKREMKIQSRSESKSDSEFNDYSIIFIQVEANEK